MRSWVFIFGMCLWSSTSSAEAPGTFDGIWQTDGYGWIIDIQGDAAQVYNAAADVCVSETSGPEPIGQALDGAKLVRGSRPEHIEIFAEQEKHPIRAKRLPGLPLTCQNGATKDPQDNLNALLAFFDQNYPFFELYGVNWHRQSAWARQVLSADATGPELFAVVAHLMTPIRDGHLSLTAEFEQWPQRFVAHKGRTLERVKDRASMQGDDPRLAMMQFKTRVWTESIADTVLKGQGRRVGNDRIQYGVLGQDVGYLALGAVGGFGPPDASAAEELRITRALFDEVLAYFERAGVKSLILDLSLNFGGDDYIAREIASRFVDRKTRAYSKYAADASDPVTTHYDISPSGGQRFGGEVLLLTSSVTVSAAEVLTLALRANTGVRHIGEPTRGALSDILPRRLPNGWRLTLSNEVYLDAEGQHWEGRGIEPHVQMEVFDDDHPVARHSQTVLALAELAEAQRNIGNGGNLLENAVTGSCSVLKTPSITPGP